MIRVQLAAAAIVFGATIAVMPLEGRAYAQTQTTPPAPSVWDHNGSTMTLVENGATREFHYQNPRPGMVEVGAHPGTLLFRGRFDNGQFAGTAYIFNPRCGPIPFPVRGSALDDGARIVLTGEVPPVGRKCRVYRTVASSLEFTRPKPAEAVPPPDGEATKPEVPSQTGGEQLGNPPATQPSATKETLPAAKKKVAGARRRTPGAEPCAGRADGDQQDSLSRQRLRKPPIGCRAHRDHCVAVCFHAGDVVAKDRVCDGLTARMTPGVSAGIVRREAAWTMPTAAPAAEAACVAGRAPRATTAPMQAAD